MSEGEYAYLLSELVKAYGKLVTSFDRLTSAVTSKDPAILMAAVSLLRESTDGLEVAVDTSKPDPSKVPPVWQSFFRGETNVANPILKQLEDEIKRATEVQASAVILLNGFNDRMTAAVEKAIANGATEAQLVDITDELDAFKAQTNVLAQAVVTNTPADNNPPSPPPPPPPVDNGGGDEGGQLVQGTPHRGSLPKHK